MKFAKLVSDFKNARSEWPLTKLKGKVPVSYGASRHIPDFMNDCYLVYAKSKKALLATGYYSKWFKYGNMPASYFDTGKKNQERKYRSTRYVSIHPFEMFCAGWLQFYDEEIWGRRSDHAVYFDWDKPTRSVTAYVCLLKHPHKGLQLPPSPGDFAGPKPPPPPPY